MLENDIDKKVIFGRNYQYNTSINNRIHKVHIDGKPYKITYLSMFKDDWGYFFDQLQLKFTEIDGQEVKDGDWRKLDVSQFERVAVISDLNNDEKRLYMLLHAIKTIQDSTIPNITDIHEYLPEWNEIFLLCNIQAKYIICVQPWIENVHPISNISLQDLYKLVCANHKMLTHFRTVGLSVYDISDTNTHYSIQGDTVQLFVIDLETITDLTYFSDVKQIVTPRLGAPLKNLGQTDENIAALCDMVQNIADDSNIDVKKVWDVLFFHFLLYQMLLSKKENIPPEKIHGFLRNIVSGIKKILRNPTEENFTKYQLQIEDFFSNLKNTSSPSSTSSVLRPSTLSKVFSTVVQHLHSVFVSLPKKQIVYVLCFLFVFWGIWNVLYVPLPTDIRLPENITVENQSTLSDYSKVFDSYHQDEKVDVAQTKLAKLSFNDNPGVWTQIKQYWDGKNECALTQYFTGGKKWNNLEGDCEKSLNKYRTMAMADPKTAYEMLSYSLYGVANCVRQLEKENQLNKEYKEYCKKVFTVSQQIIHEQDMDDIDSWMQMEAAANLAFLMEAFMSKTEGFYRQEGHDECETLFYSHLEVWKKYANTKFIASRCLWTVSDMTEWLDWAIIANRYQKDKNIFRNKAIKTIPKVGCTTFIDKSTKWKAEDNNSYCSWAIESVVRAEIAPIPPELRFGFWGLWGFLSAPDHFGWETTLGYFDKHQYRRSVDERR